MNIKQLKMKIKTVKQMFKNNFFIKEWKEIDKEEKIFYWSTREILTIVCILTIAILFLNYMFFCISKSYKCSKSLWFDITTNK